eukprot:COSAG02_NODE_5614_length_4181_cov_11.419157_1_plen_96_part_10
MNPSVATCASESRQSSVKYPNIRGGGGGGGVTGGGGLAPLGGGVGLEAHRSWGGWLANGAGAADSTRLGLGAICVRSIAIGFVDNRPTRADGAFVH